MKLMICGKGGSGKSTLTALLAQQYAAAGKRVLVVDTDVSNVALHGILGLTAPSALADYFFSRPSTREALRGVREGTVSLDQPLLGTWTFETIPEGLAAGTERMKLVRVGKIPDAETSGKGRWVAIARQFLAGLALSESDRTIIDTDAGMEHLVRGMGTACDQFLVMVDPSFESILLAGHVARAVAPLGKPLSFFLNKVDAGTASALRTALPPEIPIVGELPHDPEILAAGLAGRQLPEGKAVAALVAALEARGASRSRPA